MAYQNPIVSPLTDSQEKLLAQLGSLKNILTLPTKKNLNLSESNQISSFDYLLRISETTVGSAFIDVLLKKFIETIFDPNNDKLERVILHSVAKTMDNRNEHISSNPNESNENWLINNTLGPLHVIFQVVKVLIVKQIIAMIFGPKDKMGYDTMNQQIPVAPFPSNQEILDNVVAADSMFSLSVAAGNEFGDMEFNTVQLKQQLDKGIVQFTISCQDIKIKLPTNFDQDMNNILNGILTTLPGVTGAPTTGLIANPAIGFDYIDNHVANEMQRINSQENVNSTRKSWLQILLDKTFVLLIISITPYLFDLINRMNSQNPALGLTAAVLVSGPLELKGLQQSDTNQFDSKSVFIKTFLNALYALLLTIILKALIKEIKKLIKNAIAKRAAQKLQNKLKKLKLSFGGGGVDTVQQTQKSAKAAESLSSFNDIFNFNNIT